MKFKWDSEKFWQIIDTHLDLSTPNGRLKILLLAGVVFMFGAIINELIALLVVIILFVIAYRLYKKQKGNGTGQVKRF